MNRTPAIPASLGWRLLAAVYDLLPLLALALLTSALLLLARGGNPVTPGSRAAYAELLLLWGIVGAYATVSWRHGGQTMGMRAWRLRLVDSDGGAPAWPALLLRYAMATLSLATLGLGFAWALFEPQRRTWHDLAAGTLVVRLPPASRPVR